MSEKIDKRDPDDDRFLPPIPDDIYDSRFPGGVPKPETPEQELFKRIKLGKRLGNMWSHEDD